MLRKTRKTKTNENTPRLVGEVFWTVRDLQTRSDLPVERNWGAQQCQTANENLLKDLGCGPTRRRSFVEACEMAARKFGFTLPVDLAAANAMRNEIAHETKDGTVEWARPLTKNEAQLVFRSNYQLYQCIVQVAGLGSLRSSTLGETHRVPVWNGPLLRTDGIYVKRKDEGGAIFLRIYGTRFAQIVMLARYARNVAREYLHLNPSQSGPFVYEGFVSDEFRGLRFGNDILVIAGGTSEMVHIEGEVQGSRGPLPLGGTYVFEMDSPGHTSATITGGRNRGEADSKPPEPPPPPKPLFVPSRTIPGITKQILASEDYLCWRDWILEAYRLIRDGTSAEREAKQTELVDMKSLIESMKLSLDGKRVHAAFHLERLIEHLEKGVDKTRPSYFAAYFMSGEPFED